MCNQCGCTVTEKPPVLSGARSTPAPMTVQREQIDIVRDILEGNERQAQHNREHFDAHRVVAVNLMSSPGSGKTALLEATIPRLRQRYRIAVIEGDLETENDARRIRAQGVPAVQITTGAACHLDAALVHSALHELDLNAIDLLFIENIGNLVCPASFGLGQHRNVTLLSVTEGDDKPAKYPVMFRASDLVLLSKTDLLPHLPEFEPSRAVRALESISAEVSMVPISIRDPDSLRPWFEWLEQTITDVRTTQRPSVSTQPHGEHAHEAFGG